MWWEGRVVQSIWYFCGTRKHQEVSQELSLHHSHSKICTIWRKGQCGETHFQYIFARKELLLQDAAFQQTLCLYIPVPDALPQHALLANTACEEPLATPPGKGSHKKSRISCLAFAHQPCHAPLLYKPPAEESFYQQLCQEAESSAMGCLALSLAKGSIFCSCACILPRSWKHTPYSAIQQALNRSGLVMVAQSITSLDCCIYYSPTPPLPPSPQKITP